MSGSQPIAPIGFDGASTEGGQTVLAGRYVLGPEIGRGGMGRVFAATDRTMSRQVAVKIISSASPTPEALARFRKEAHAVGSLSHPNIIAVHDAGEHQGQPFLVSELLRGQPLRQLLLEGPLPLQRALRLGAQIARGLAAAHERRIVHRDLKPENIFISTGDWTKILDFGLAKLLDTQESTVSEPGREWDSTRPGRIMGTAGYMSPEQVRGEDVTPAADLFAFGAVLYELVGGQRAFRGATAVEMGYAILRREPPPLEGVPSELAAIVSTCLAKDPARRKLSATQVAERLEALRQGHTHTDHIKWPLRRLGAGVAIVTLIGASISGGAYAWRFIRHASAGDQQPLSGTIAVLPFEHEGGDALAPLGEDLVLLMSRDVTSPSLRATPATSVIRAAGIAKGNGSLRNQSIAEAVGAGLLVNGVVRGTPDALRIHAEVRRIGRDEPLRECDVQGSQRDLLLVASQLGEKLGLHANSAADSKADGGAGLQRLTAYPEALHAYLEAERLHRRGRYSDVAAAFQRAIAIDHEFALAQYRLAATSDWQEPGLARDALTRALQHPERLTANEQTLAEARAAMEDGLIDDAERLLRNLVRQHPEDAEAWLQLAELYFHFNPERARSISEALEPLQQALILDPFQSAATEHLIDLAQLRDERPLIVALCDRYLAQSDPEPLATLAIQMLRALEAGDAAGRAELLAKLAQSDTDRLPRVTTYIRLMWQGDYADAEAIARMVASSPSSVQRAQGQTYLGAISLARGQPAAARDFFARAQALDPNGEAAFYRPWMDTLDWVPSTPTDLHDAAEAAKKLRPDINPEFGPARAWLLGALAIRANERKTALEQVAELEQMPPLDLSSIAQDLALSLRARLADAEGDPRRALSLLQQQQHRIPLRHTYFFAKSSEAFMRGRLLARLGRPDEALRAYESMFVYHAVEPLLLPRSVLASAELREQLGDRSAASAGYSRFADMWRDAEPPLRAQALRASQRAALSVATAPGRTGH